MAPLPPTCEKWGCTLRQNFDKLLLVGLIIVLLVYGLHVMHAADVDNATLSWVREIAMTVTGGLLGLIQGQRAQQHQGDTIKAGDNTTVNIPPPVPAQAEREKE